MNSISSEKSAIVGYSGFVGQNLLSAREFSDRFNSRNLANIAGGDYSIVICAAAPATMWAANKDPEGDLRNIKQIVSHLSTAKAKHFVLVSTVAVLADASAGLDENDTQFETGKAYGRNRRFLEEACIDLFPNVHIVRLPALFGRGLKKNFLFDILNPTPSFLTKDKYSSLIDALPPAAADIMDDVYALSPELGMYACDREKLTGEARTVLEGALEGAGFTALNFTNADSTFQYYNLGHLWRDIERVIAHDLPLMHLAPEPLSAGEVYAALTGKELQSRSAALYHEDMRTRHSAIWGGPDGYISPRAAVLADLKAFYAGALPA